eukprot:4114073-Amphidinium_carterae.1
MREVGSSDAVLQVRSALEQAARAATTPFKLQTDFTNSPGPYATQDAKRQKLPVKLSSMNQTVIVAWLQFHLTDDEFDYTPLAQI